LNFFYSEYKDKANKVQNQNILLVDEFLKQNKKLQIDDLFKKFRIHMGYIKNVYYSYIPHPKNTNFTSYVFPYLSDETIEKLLGDKRGRFILRIARTLESKLAISVRNEIVQKYFFEVDDSLSDLSKFSEMCSPKGMCDPKTVDWFKSKDVIRDQTLEKLLTSIETSAPQTIPSMSLTYMDNGTGDAYNENFGKKRKRNDNKIQASKKGRFQILMVKEEQINQEDYYFF